MSICHFKSRLWMAKKNLSVRFEIQLRTATRWVCQRRILFQKEYNKTMFSLHFLSECLGAS